ncbi:MAG: hypothetical protein NTW06_04325 [Candidatus Falkowbacteria bacterium]|nr:hypothetical protein [Candidatus Falkowbacteria bacterium]
MKPKIYKSFGVFLITLTFIIITSVIFYKIAETNIFIKKFGALDFWQTEAIEGILISIAVIIFSFFPGLFYYRFGNEIRESSRIVISAFVLQILPIVLIIIGSSYYFYTCRSHIGGNDTYGIAMLLLIVGVATAIPYGIGILLLIIYKFKTKNFRLQTTEKIVLTILFLILILIGAIFGMEIYEISSRSIEKCDSKRNPKSRDVCHYFLSLERPDLVICEKIRDSYPEGTWRRNECYRRKAQYYKDPSFCDKITENIDVITDPKFSEMDDKEYCLISAR